MQRGEERERGGDQVGDRKASRTAADDDVVEPLAEPVVDGGVVGEVGAAGVDRLGEAGARAVDVDVVEQAGCELELLQRVDLRVEHERRALQDRLVGGGGEPRGGDRREDREHEHDPDVAGDERARRLVTGRARG